MFASVVSCSDNWNIGLFIEEELVVLSWSLLFTNKNVNLKRLKLVVSFCNLFPRSLRPQRVTLFNGHDSLMENFKSIQIISWENYVHVYRHIYILVYRFAVIENTKALLIPTPAFLLNLKLDLSAETTHWFSQVHSIPPNAGFIIVKSLLVIISLLQYQRFWKMKRKEKGKYYRVYYVLWQYYRTYFIMLGKRMWFVYTIWFFILWNSHVSHANLAITISSSQNVILWTELIYKLATMKNF